MTTLEQNLIRIESERIYAGLTQPEISLAIETHLDMDALIQAVRDQNGSLVGALILGAMRTEVQAQAITNADAIIAAGTLTLLQAREVIGEVEVT